MKINNHAAKSLLNNNASDAVQKSSMKRPGSASKKSAVDSSQAAKVDLSARAKDINKAMNVAKGTKTDSAKLDRLQQMIDKGEYKVAADQVADRLVNEHLIFKG